MTEMKNLSGIRLILLDSRETIRLIIIGFADGIIKPRSAGKRESGAQNGREMMVMFHDVAACGS